MILANEVLKISGQDVYKCFQCGECASSCQVVGVDDFRPNKLVHMVQMGMDEVVDKRLYEPCLHCYLCTVRCPQGLSFPDIATALSNMRVRKYGVGRIEKAFMDELRRRAFINPAKVAISSIGVLGSLKMAGFKGVKLAGILKEGGGVPEEIRREVRRIVR